MAEKRVSVRLVAEGGRQVRAELEGIGEQIDAYSIEADVGESDDKYPLVLMPRTELFRSSPRVGHTSWMEPVVPAAEVLMHPDDAERLGLNEGQLVSVESRHGSLHLTLKLSPGVPLGAVSVNDYLPDQPLNRLLVADDDTFAVKVVAAS